MKKRAADAANTNTRGREKNYLYHNTKRGKCQIMRTSKIYIRNLLGISEKTLDGKSVELIGPKGAGKSSVLDAIRYALTNQSNRDYIIRQGEDEGEIIIETDSGLQIDRKARTTKADEIKVRDGNIMQTRPAEFLRGLFTPLQLNPIEFLAMPRQEKNRVILSLIDFDWNLDWIQAQFGEIPQGVDYSKHILEVLADIQAYNGVYFQSRQSINRDIRNAKALVEDIGRVIPGEYDANYWEQYSLGDKYRELERIKDTNGKIDRAQVFSQTYTNKVRGLQADRDIAINAEQKAVANERSGLNATIARLKAEIAAAEDKMIGLDAKLSDKVAVIEAQYKERVAKLDGDNQIAAEWAGRTKTDTRALESELENAEKMKKHLNEYRRMVAKQGEIERMQAESDELTRKIELARELPASILKTAKIPIDGLTVEEGIPLIHGLPISNLSDGELLDLCVEVSISVPGQLQIILIDGAEKLDTESRNRLYAKCKEKGLQIIATRTTDDDGLTVIEL